MVQLNPSIRCTTDVINELPDCLMLVIFKHCTKVDLWRARTVCRRWYTLLADSELWRVCNLTNFKFDNFALLMNILDYMPVKDLQYFELHNSVILTEVLNVILEIANQLRGLRLNHCTVRNGTQKMLPPRFIHPHKLQYLDTRKSIGNFLFLDSLLTTVGKSIKALGKLI